MTCAYVKYNTEVLKQSRDKILLLLLLNLLLINNKGDAKSRWNHLTICFANKGRKDQVQIPVEGTCALMQPSEVGVPSRSITCAVTVAKGHGTRSRAQVMRTAPSVKISTRKVPFQSPLCLFFLVQLALLPHWLPIRSSLAAQCLGEGISALFITNSEPRGKRATRHQNVSSDLGNGETKSL